jgi:hypothetical protein
MSDDIAKILDRLRVIESDLTPVSVKKGQNKQQKSVPQLPALFKPENVSPVLGGRQKKPFGNYMVGDSQEPTRNALAEQMAEIDEDMLSRVRQDLGQYLDYLEAKKDDEIEDKKKHLERQAVKKVQDKNPAKPGDQDEYSETEEPMLSGTAQMTPVSVGECNYVKTIALEDGAEFECWEHPESGVEIRHGGRVLPSRFRSMADADMAVNMFGAHRRGQPQDPSSDYLEEK